MKKIVGIIGVAVLAIAMYTNTNNNEASNVSLSELATVNTADAENMPPSVAFAYCNMLYPYDFVLFSKCMSANGS